MTFERVPQAASEQATSHVTPRLAASFWTVAVKFCVRPTTTLAEDGATDTEIGGGWPVTVMAAEADLEASATETARNVTPAGLGTDPGAV